MNKALTLLLIAGLALPFVALGKDSPEDRITALGLTLQDAPASIANYVPSVKTGNLVFLAGQIARDPEGKIITGKVGRELSTLQASEAARQCTMQLLAALKAELGDLNHVKRIVRVSGFVNCTDDFTAQSTVINGCSDLLVAIFGEAGRHARTSIGVNSLPSGAPVEIEMIVEVGG